MFSGIVEEYATVVALEKEQENLHITMTCSFADMLKVDQSVSHNGVCLTVVKVNKKKKTYTVTAIRETLDKTNLGLLTAGSKVNLERSMTMDKLL
ncbi:MAG: riboflavin synthase, partial [Bacteroidetes bacterium]|nr:riboflavin synthase [Bacteroidota bacterium]